MATGADVRQAPGRETQQRRGGGDAAPTPYPDYRKLWFFLSLGWVASGVDRTITGPVVTYMIGAKVPMLSAVDNPFAVGGLVGSLLFAGYMLMQFPGGSVGDKVGHRTVIVLGILWAGIATLLSGVVTALVGFVALRVLTGLGAGLFFSNDRSVISRQTPFEKRSLGMGWVITGLAVGITLALVLAAPLLDLGTSVFGADDAWRLPFIGLGILAIVIAISMALFFRSQKGEHAYEAAYWPALKRLLPYMAAFFVAVMAIYVAATEAGLSEWLVAVIELALALVLVGFIFVRRGDDVGPVVRNRDLMLINVGMIAILWNLWFFGFWSVSIVKDATHGGFWGAALTATFWGVAGIIGYPVGGWLADRDKKRGRGRRPKLVVFAFIQGVITIGFGLYIATGGNSVWALAPLMFTASLFFNAEQPIAHALVADLVPEPRYFGAAFGMNNLIAEMGAVLAPAISGVLRDATGGWSAAVLVDGGLIMMSFVLFALVREPKVKLTPGRG